MKTKVAMTLNELRRLVGQGEASGKRGLNCLYTVT